MIEMKELPLWLRIFYFIILQVEIDDGTVESEINSKMAEYFKVKLTQINRGRKKLIDKNWIIKYTLLVLLNLLLFLY